MKERPILFSGPMVRAVLDGWKTQTRRPIKSLRHPYGHLLGPEGVAREFNAKTESIRCPLGQPGDRLWVRETWGLMAHHDPTDWHRGSIDGASEDSITPMFGVEHRANWKIENENAFWRPSIHMPRWASRITLEIVHVRVERVQDITEEDAKAEAPDMFLKATSLCTEDPRMYMLKEGAWGSAFHDLWQSIYGTWDANPWVWAVEFRRTR